MLLYAADAPHWADKLEAWATLAAAVLSASAVVVAILVVRKEQKTRREDKFDADAAQARLVTTWLSALGSREEGWLGLRYRVRNLSPYAISEVALLLGAADRYDVNSVIRTDEIPGEKSHGGEFRFSDPLPWRWGSRAPRTNDILERVTATVKFTDSAGLRWSRLKHDHPHREPVFFPRRAGLRLLADLLYLADLRIWIGKRSENIRRRFREMAEDHLDSRIRKRSRRHLKREFGDDWESVAARLYKSDRPD